MAPVSTNQLARVVPRRVRVSDRDQEKSEGSHPQPLTEFRDLHAWILLGEPGAGKSTAFQDEAIQTDSTILRIDDFLDLELDPALQGKTVFLDGLDEVRARSGDGVISELRRRLQQLGRTRFRIACRSADWYDATDRDDLRRASHGDLKVLVLEPLNGEEILQILFENHGVADPSSFIQVVARDGLQDLLSNPLTLELLVKSHRDGKPPKSKEEAYRLGCESLARELNVRHQLVRREDPCPPEKILEAAGQMAAVILLADLHGIALTQPAEGRRFATLADFTPPDHSAARLALDSRLFRSQGADRLIPIHRTVTEYLGATWLARHVDRWVLPGNRLQRLVTGLDGRSISGLRGLFGWLATLCGDIRLDLIQADPISILAYGDIRQLGVQSKRAILAALRREAEINPTFNWDLRNDQIYGGLACVDLLRDLQRILECPDRDKAQAVHLRCVLDALEYGEPLPELDPLLWKIVEDPTHWQTNRKDALNICLMRGGDPAQALQLLSKVSNGDVEDEDDALLGILLGHLYPAHLSPESLLPHIKPRKNPNFFGGYDWFVRHELAELAETAHIPLFLDGLTNREDLGEVGIEESHVSGLIEALLIRGVRELGDTLDGAGLLRWFCLGDENGFSGHRSKDRLALLDWLGGHPDRYKEIVSALFDHCRLMEDPEGEYWLRSSHLVGATVPDDLGLWHLNLVETEPNSTLARLHLLLALRALWDGQGTQGLSSEHIFRWAEPDDVRGAMLRPLLVCEIQSWRQDQVGRSQARQSEAMRKRVEHRDDIYPELNSVREGTAPTGLMRLLAGIWRGLFINAQGPSPAERFKNYCEGWEEVLTASEAGFPRCLERSDIPSAAEIIKSRCEKQEYHLQYPCLIGMEMLWNKQPETCLALRPDLHRSLVAFLLVSLEPPKEWFLGLVAFVPLLVSEVFVDYVQASWENGDEHIYGFDWIDGLNGMKPLADTALLPLLEAYPIRKGGGGRVRQLEMLLKAAFTNDPSLLAPLCRKLDRALLGEMDRAQQVLWVMSDIVLNAKDDLAPLWELIGSDIESLILAGDFLNWFHGHYHQLGTRGVALIGGLVERLAPHASQVDRMSGPYTSGMQCQDLVRGFIHTLGAMNSLEVGMELERLIQIEALSAYEFQLKQMRAQHRASIREAEYQFLGPAQVVHVLSSGIPVSVDDLTHLVLDHLDQIAKELKHENDDGIRGFWNVVNHQPQGAREENLCRDQVLTRLRYRLRPLGVECAPEFDYANDKRADIRVAYRADFAVPIEIKKDSNRQLWTGLEEQLISHYSHDSLAQGYGIYLVLWFGGDGIVTDPGGNEKPTSIECLEKRLESRIPAEAHDRVFVRVIDVSWPETPRNKAASAGGGKGLGPTQTIDLPL